jgi:hypothetical protein
MLPIRGKHISFQGSEVSPRRILITSISTVVMNPIYKRWKGINHDLSNRKWDSKLGLDETYKVTGTSSADLSKLKK